MQIYQEYNCSKITRINFRGSVGHVEDCLMALTRWIMDTRPLWSTDADVYPITARH
jgi:hypothetical protein